MTEEKQGRRLRANLNMLLSFATRHRILLLALLLTALRFALWDYQYLTAMVLPKHDGLHGVSAFAASMHSLRMGDGFAWWNPVDPNGYAIYYLGFLQPLAPTYGSIGFIMAGGLVKVLSLFSVVIPEYVLYIVLNSLLYPFLTGYFLLKLGSCFFQRTSTLLFLGVGYFFSVIGLWNDSWYYWQDPFYMFMLLYAVVRFVKTPDRLSGIFLCAAVVLFLAAADYWAMHNMLFIICFLVLFFVHTGKDSMRACLRGLWQFLRHNKIIIIITLVCCCVWVAQIGSVFLEQHSIYIRNGLSSGYSMHDVTGRANPQAISNRITGLFHWGFTSGDDQNPVHKTSYMGVLLPLLVIALLFRQNKQIRFFFKLLVVTFILCIVPGFLLPAWKVFLSFDQHFFYFYLTFMQFAVLLLATMALECLQKADLPALKQNRLMPGFLITGSAAWLLCLFTGQPNTYTTACLLCLVGGFLCYAYLREKALIWLVIFLVLFIGDLTTYYNQLSYADNAFSMWMMERATPDTDDKLYQPFAAEQNNTFDQNIYAASAKVDNYLWPTNNFMPSFRVNPYSWSLKWGVFDSEPDPLSFYTDYTDVSAPEMTSFSATDRLDYSFEFVKYGYNDFELVYTADTDCWGVLKQQYDSHWRLVLDGTVQLTFEEANGMHMAVQLPAGEHTITMSFNPFSRKLYPFAAGLLVVCLLVFYWRYMLLKRYHLTAHEKAQPSENNIL